jgi:hypothetical protein
MLCEEDALMIKDEATHEATPLVIGIAKDFISLVREIEPKWQKAYLRFVSRDSVAQAKGSYTHEAGTEIINVMKHKGFFHSVTKKGQELLAALGKDEGLFLLVSDSSFKYDIMFEYQNLKRWEINKLAGNSGVPEGIE